MAGAGASVAIAGRCGDKNARVLEDLRARENLAVALSLDVMQRGELEPAVRRIEEKLGPLGILLNNAALVSIGGGVPRESPENWDNVIETQLTSVLLLSKLAIQSMKGGAVRLTNSRAVELAPSGIQVNATAPGFIETDMTATGSTEERATLNAEIIARVGDGPAEFGDRSSGTVTLTLRRRSEANPRRREFGVPRIQGQ